MKTRKQFKLMTSNSCSHLLKNLYSYSNFSRIISYMGYFLSLVTKAIKLVPNAAAFDKLLEREVVKAFGYMR